MFHLRVAVLFAVALAFSAVISANVVFDSNESAPRASSEIRQYIQKESVSDEVSPVIDIPWEDGQREICKYIHFSSQEVIKIQSHLLNS